MRRKCSDVLWRIWADIGYCGGPGMVAFAHRAHRIVGLPRHRQLRHLRRSKSPFRVLVVRLPPVIHPEVDAEGFRTGDNRFAAERPTPPGRCNSPARQSIVRAEAVALIEARLAALRAMMSPIERGVG